MSIYKVDLTAVDEDHFDTYPVKVVFCGTELHLERCRWAIVYETVIRKLYELHPQVFWDIVNAPTRSFGIRGEYTDNFRCIRLDDGLYISINHSTKGIINYLGKFMKKCGRDLEELEIWYTDDKRDLSDDRGKYKAEVLPTYIRELLPKLSDLQRFLLDKYLEELEALHREQESEVHIDRIGASPDEEAIEIAQVREVESYRQEVAKGKADSEGRDETEVQADDTEVQADTDTAVEVTVRENPILRDRKQFASRLYARLQSEDEVRKYLSYLDCLPKWYGQTLYALPDEELRATANALFMLISKDDRWSESEINNLNKCILIFCRFYRRLNVDIPLRAQKN